MPFSSSGSVSDFVSVMVISRSGLRSSLFRSSDSGEWRLLPSLRRVRGSVVCVADAWKKWVQERTAWGEGSSPSPPSPFLFGAPGTRLSSLWWIAVVLPVSRFARWHTTLYNMVNLLLRDVILVILRFHMCSYCLSMLIPISRLKNDKYTSGETNRYGCDYCR